MVDPLDDFIFVEIEEKFWNRKMEERFGIILNNVEFW